MNKKVKWVGTLSTTERNHIGLIRVRQNNVTSEVLGFEIIDGNGEPYDLKNRKVLFCTYFDKFSPVEQYAEVIENGKIIYTMNEHDMQKPVRINFAYFKIMDDKDNLVDTTQNFSYDIIPSIESKCGDFGPYIIRLEEVLDAFNSVRDQAFKEMQQIIIDFNQQIIEQQQNFDIWFESIREILESIDPGGILLQEVVEARGEEESLNKRLNISEKKIDMNVSKDNISPLFIQTFDGSNQPYHPYVMYFKNGWNGKRYWMAYTPFPIDSQGYMDRWECPSIACSNDGITWTTPVGLTNPLHDLTPDQVTRKDFFSDTAIVMNGSQMEVWYRHTNGSNTSNTDILRMTSFDGVKWSGPEKVVDSLINNGLSPNKTFRSHTIVKEGTKYISFYCSDTGLFRAETTDPKNSIWLNNIKLKNTNGLDINYWHASVVFDDIDNEYKMIGYDSNKRTIELLSSKDGYIFEFKEIIYDVRNKKHSNIVNLYQAMAVRTEGGVWSVYSSCQFEYNSTLSTQKVKNGLFLLKGNTLENMIDVKTPQTEFSRINVNSNIFLNNSNKPNSVANNIILASDENEAMVYKLGVKFDSKGTIIPMYEGKNGRNHLLSAALDVGEPKKDGYVGEFYINSSDPSKLYFFGFNNKWNVINIGYDKTRLNLKCSKILNIGKEKRIVINVADEHMLVQQISGGFDGQEIIILNVTGSSITIEHEANVSVGKIHTNEKSNKLLKDKTTIRFIKISNDWYEC